MAFKNAGVKWITFGWVSFIAENLILSENRTEIIEKFGNDSYHQVYNTLSTLACGSIAWGYLKHGRGMGPTFRARVGIPSLVAGTLIQTIGLVGFAQLLPKLQVPWEIQYENKDSVPSSSITSNSQSITSEASKPATGIKFAARCPMDFRSTKAPANPDEVSGLERITRYPFLWAFGFTCFGSALSTIYWTERVMFSFPMIFALIGSTHQDSRFRRGKGGYLSPEKESKSSLIPFVALLEGKQSWQDVAKELKELNTLLAIGAGGLLGLTKFLRMAK